jgi:tetratricopeptide (TPR) repeat protein
MSLRAWIGAACLVLAAANAARAGVVDDARKALDNGDYAKALELAGKVADNAKDKPKALCVIGDVELEQEHWEAAEKAFRDALAKKNNWVPAMTGVGRALTGQKKFGEGGEILTAAMKLDNQNIPMWHALCENLMLREKPDDWEGARIDLVATLMLDAKDPTTNRMLVEVLLKQGKIDDADKAAETYAKADKDSAMSWFLRGLVLEKRSKPDKAIEAYLKAVKKDDRLRDAHGNVARVMAASDTGDKNVKRLEDALVHAQRYVDLGGKDKTVLELLEKLKASSPAPAK